MKEIVKHALFVFCLIFILILPYLVFADNVGELSQDSGTALDKLKTLGSGAGYDAEASETTLASTLGDIVSIFLGLLGIIFIILIIWAGFKYMIARGNSEEMQKALNIIKGAIIGLLIIAFSYAIWAFVNDSFLSIKDVPNSKFALVSPVLALELPDDQTNAFKEKTGLGTEIDLENTLADIIETLLGFLGILFLGLLIWAGFKYMIARGDSGEAQKALKIINTAVIGLIIVVSAYAITYFVFENFIG